MFCPWQTTKKTPRQSRKFVCPGQRSGHSLQAHLSSGGFQAVRAEAEGTVHDESRQEVTTVRLYLIERPSALALACAWLPGTGINAQHETVQVQRTQAQSSSNQADQIIDGFAAKAIGMDLTSRVTGVKVSGAPPRGKPV